MSTLFRDSAGTTPVTAVEQPVGRMLDKSGRGNHAMQATTTKRPVLKIDAGGRYYLSFDGVDDALQTGNIDFTGTYKMTVCAGVTKLSDAAAGIVCELSASATAINPGSFCLFAPLSASASYRYVSQGQFIRPVDYKDPSMAAPHSGVATGLSDIAGDAVILRINMAQVGQNVSDGGTGTYGNHPLYIGARAGTSLFFNGRLYGLIVRGAQSSLSQIEATELYMKKKVGIA